MAELTSVARGDRWRPRHVLRGPGDQPPGPVAHLPPGL